MKCPRCGSENVSIATTKKVDVGLSAVLKAENRVGGIAYICEIKCKDCGLMCLSVHKNRDKAIKACIEKWESGDFQ